MGSKTKKEKTLSFIRNCGLALLLGTVVGSVAYPNNLKLFFNRKKALSECHALRSKQKRLEPRIKEVQMAVNKMDKKRMEIPKEILKRIDPKHPMILNTVKERIRIHIKKLQHKRFSPYLLFDFHYSVWSYLAYQNTPSRQIPQDIKDLFKYKSGDCKDYTALLASLFIAGGAKVRYVGSRSSYGGVGHAFLFVRIFEKPSPKNMKMLQEYFEYARDLHEMEKHKYARPIGRMFEDGYYVVCDPTNVRIPGIISEEYVKNLEPKDIIEISPEDYGIKEREMSLD